MTDVFEGRVWKDGSGYHPHKLFVFLALYQHHQTTETICESKRTSSLFHLMVNVHSHLHL